jgi:dTDP-4-amino-4,6-dideoxygalactose transaminase
LSELQYAVALAQMDKVDSITAARRKLAAALTKKIECNEAIIVPEIHPHSQSSFWFYMFRVKPERINCTLAEFVDALKAEGIPAMAGYIPRPVYQEKMFAEKAFFPGGIWPAEIISGRKYVYEKGLCPVAEEVLSTSVRVPVSEFFSEQDMDDMAEAINKVLAAYQIKTTSGGNKEFQG